jgi:5-methyltetrahydrofolate--homocysteine methyltransferase
VEQRLEDCETIMDALTGMGIKEEQVYFDPLVMPVSVGPRNGIVTLQTIEEIKARFPNSKTVVGLSNISFGLPDRRLLNHSFLMLAFQAGLDAAIMDPLDRKLMSAVKTAMLFPARKGQLSPVSGFTIVERSYIRRYESGTERRTGSTVYTT